MSCAVPANIVRLVKATFTPRMGFPTIHCIEKTICGATAAEIVKRKGRKGEERGRFLCRSPFRHCRSDITEGVVLSAWHTLALLYPHLFFLPRIFPQMRGFALLLALATMAVAMAQVAPDVTDRPIIGVFTHPRPTAANPKRRYLAASYVKWIEAAGGRVVPLPYEMNDTAARAIIRKVNGLLFPGGSADLNPTARNLMKLALQINDNGDVFPVWGTCLGFEWLSQYYGGDSILNPTDSENLALALELADPLTLRQSLVMFLLFLHFFSFCFSRCLHGAHNSTYQGNTNFYGIQLLHTIIFPTTTTTNTSSTALRPSRF